MPRGKESLEEYQAKRHFEKTSEPPAHVHSDREGSLLFVVQKHDATRLHYDLRLELDGVLKSWAVPKGFMLGDEKHMAVMVEDHPFDYGSFEGTIPKGEYGAGEVIVWDCGTYWCDEWDKFPAKSREDAEDMVRKQIEDGKLSFFLRGSKLKGSWALVKMKTGNDWLLLKHKDRYHNEQGDPLAVGDSAISGFSIEDIQRGLKLPPRMNAADLVANGKKEPFPKKLQPMMASLADHPFDDPAWVFEPKLDGIRVLVFIERESVRMESRNGNDLSNQFPALCRELQQQYTGGMVLDGEIVAFEGETHHFNSMLKRLHVQDKAALAQFDATIPCAFYAFDLLHFEGIDVRSKKLSERRRLLEQVLLPTDLVKLTSQIPEEGKMLYQAVLAAGFEGVVAKRADSIYDPGRRAKTWLKLKASDSSEFVVGGYLRGEGARTDTLGSVMLGYYKDAELVYVGNAGSGFTDESLDLVKGRLDAIQSDRMPFSEKPPLLGHVVWTKPEMVVEVKYNQITPAGMLRGPVFLRVREDKIAEDVGPPAKPVHVESVEGPGPVEAPKTQKGRKEDSEIEAVLAQLDNKTANIELAIGDARIPVTNLNKELWPASEENGLGPFTKRDLLAYLAQVSPYMIPHTQDRPLTLIRWPEGIYGQKFFQKHWEQRKPDFVEDVQLFSESNRENQRYLLLNNLPTLLWLGQLGTLEYHIWGSRCVGGPDTEGLTLNFLDNSENIDGSVLNYPDFIKFDIDPYIYSGKEKEGDEPELNKEAFTQGVTVAFWLKQLLDSLSLNAFVKTTGKTGLHIFVPIVRNLDYDAVRSICETFCRMLEREHPREVTTEWQTKKRTGKIFLDFNMNTRAKTLGSPFCPRALPNQAMAMPVTWEELPDVYPNQFTMRSAPERLARTGDAWENMLNAKKDLAKVVGM